MGYAHHCMVLVPYLAFCVCVCVFFNIRFWKNAFLLTKSVKVSPGLGFGTKLTKLALEIEGLS